MFKPVFGGFVIGQNPFNLGPETGAVIHFFQMGKFMRNDIVNQLRAKVDQAPVQANVAIGTTGSPTGCGTGQAKTQGFCSATLLEMPQADFKPGQGTALKPLGAGCFNCQGICRGWQVDIEPIVILRQIVIALIAA